MILLHTGDRWTVGGLPMDCAGWWRDPSKGGKGLALTPPRRDTSTSIPGRRGVTPGLIEYDAGALALNLVVVGVDPDTGQVPTGSTTAEQLDRNLGVLHAALHAPRLDLRRDRHDGAARRADGTLDQAPDVEIANSHPASAALGAVIRIDGAFWCDADPVTDELRLHNGQVGQLWAFEGATAPMDDLDWVIGPAWNPVVTDVGSGTWLAYDGAVLPGQSLRYDGATRRVYGGGDLLVDQGLVRRGRWLHLAPGRPPAVTVTHTGPHPVTVQVSGRRAYLTA